MPPSPRARVRWPTFACTVAQQLCQLVWQETIDRDARAVYLTHEQFAELCRRGLGRGSAKTSRNAAREAERAGWLEAIPGYAAPEEVPGAARARCRLSGKPAQRIRRGNLYRPGPLMLAARDRDGIRPAKLLREAERAARREREKYERKKAGAEHASSRPAQPARHPLPSDRDLALRSDLDPSRSCITAHRARGLSVQPASPTAICPQPDRMPDEKARAPSAPAVELEPHERPALDEGDEEQARRPTGALRGEGRGGAPPPIPRHLAPSRPPATMAERKAPGEGFDGPALERGASATTLRNALSEDDPRRWTIAILEKLGGRGEPPPDS